MASETIKALLMIALFGVLEVALYGPRMLQTLMHLRRLRLNWLYRPAHPATAFALVRVRVRYFPRRH
jgi:hypothetical protein